MAYQKLLWAAQSSLLFLFLGARAWAFSGTEGASFLDIPVGAGPAALGGAYSALATDAYAPVYNPSGLGFLPATEMAGQHTAYLSSIHYEFLSFVHPFTASDGLGASLQYLGSSNIPGTNDQGVGTGDFTDYFAAYSLAYGHAFTDRFSLGAGGKWIHGKLADVSADAYAGDVGALFRISDALQAAATVTNLGSSFRFLDQKDPLPLAYKLGLGWSPSEHWTWTGEGWYERSGLASFHTGLEWRPLRAITLRAGYKTDTTRQLSALAGFTVGAGLRLWGQEFAYAWLPLGDLGDTNYFSLVLRFGAPPKDSPRRNLKRYAQRAPDEMGL